MTALLGVLAGLCSCRNAVYFYEREAFSLTAEGRVTDPTSPVSANLGIKQRVVLIVPPGDPEATLDASKLDSQPHLTEAEKIKMSKDDAVSVISYFNLVKDDTQNFLKPELTIETSFITGMAARVVAEQKNTGVVTQAIANVGSFAPADFTAVFAMYRALSSMPDSVEKARVVGLMDALAARIPPTWPVSIYRVDQAATNLLVNATEKEGQAVASAGAGYTGLNAYWQTLEDSLANLNGIAKADATVDKPGSFEPTASVDGIALAPIPDTSHAENARARVLSHRERTAKLLEQLRSDIEESGAISALAAFYSKKLGN